MIRFTRKKHKRRSQQGLTLYELLIVLAILAMLATLIAPRVVGYLGRAKSDTARTQLSNLATSLELYFFDVGTYPTEDQGLKALLEAPAGITSWRGPYLKEIEGLTDPWGRTYSYKLDLETDIFTVSTLGRDGVEGGKGEDADIFKK